MQALRSVGCNLALILIIQTALYCEEYRKALTSEAHCKAFTGLRVSACTDRFDVDLVYKAHPAAS